MPAFARSIVSIDDSGAPNVFRRTCGHPGVMRDYARKRSYPLPRVLNSSGSIFSRAFYWLYPWATREYPGRVRGLLAVLDNRVTRQSIHRWARNDRPAVWAARAMVEHLEERSRIGMELAAELRAYIQHRENEVSRVGWALTKAGRAQRAAAKLPE
jgi:hypothetical protein